MSNHILFRLPEDKVVHELFCGKQVTQLGTYTEIGNVPGYVFSPFSPSSQSPILLFRPEEEKAWILPKRFSARHIDYTDTAEQERTAYQRAFAKCMKQLEDNRVRKIVLSRRLTLHLDSIIDEEDRKNLFIAACNNYPHAFIALIETKKWGIWLIATPELLLEEKNGSLHTMALAATMSVEEGGHLLPEAWSQKNQAEQAMVADYIEEKLTQLHLPHSRSAVYLKQAAHLVHLCTDFTAPLPSSNLLGNIIEALHPTPAVCGLPTDQASCLLSEIEDHDRKYYAGFSGPVLSDAGTHLFVTLRCMSLHENTATLYAGGGLLRSSDIETEWIETHRKMKTMLHLLQ